MTDRLRERMAAALSRESFGVLSVEGCSHPVRYRTSPRLEIDCLVPRWSDMSDPDLLEQPAPATLIVPMAPQPDCWLRCLGEAAALKDPDWEALAPPHSHRLPPDDLYLPVRLIPRRIDLVDERNGWGSRETLDF